MSMGRLARSSWERLPDPAKRVAKGAWAGYARLTSGSRALPSYLIIGTQRGGTTSLYKYLVQHPNLSHALTKELRFFDLNYERGLAWYRSRFPTERHLKRGRGGKGSAMMVGEASPDYLFHPHAPARIARALPDVKLIVLLRDPVERAFSHYWHQFRRGHEELSFAEAIEREPERLAGELERMLADERYVSYERHHHSYMARGVYADQLAAWMDLFPADRFLIERSEDFFDDPPLVFKRVLAFLGLPEWELPSYERYNAFRSGEIDPGLRRRLAEYFRPHNRRLSHLLQRDFGWDDR